VNYELSTHVQREMERRRIPLAVVEAALASPGQRVPEQGDVVCYQSKAKSITDCTSCGRW
jgi:hypothetical protein